MFKPYCACSAQLQINHCKTVQQISPDVSTGDFKSHLKSPQSGITNRLFEGYFMDLVIWFGRGRGANM